MKIADFRRLKGLMCRTTSDSDPEALSAVRAANRILTSEGLTWDRVLDRVVTVIDAIEPDPATSRAANIIPPRSKKQYEELLREAEQAAQRQPRSAQDFVASVAEQWEERAFISVKQVTRLEEIRDK